ncbi:MAG: NADP-dependent oxidoreductase [Acidimicrobiales bacterium]
MSAPDVTRPSTNRRIVVARRPVGAVTPDCFRLESVPVPELADGEALAAVRYLSIDPTIRGWISHDTYLPAVPHGDVVRRGGTAVVVASRRDDLPVGSAVFGMTGWQELCVLGPGDQVQPLPDGIDLADALGVYGVTGITAYVGMLEYGRPQAGETVVVSGAAGATGSVAGQIARIRGARVIGIAGGAEKCAWLTDALGFAAAVDYRTEDVGARLGELCPDGLDVFYDNVGGDILEAALDHLAIGARIVLCGAIATYNDVEPRPGPRNLSNLIVQRARMEGFLLLDHVDRFAEAALTLAGWVADGEIRHRTDVVEGLEHAPDALDRLFTGANTGKVVVHVAG